MKSKKIKKVNKNGFPEPKKVLCSNCKKTEFLVKFVIPSLAYSKKNNLGFWTEKEEDKSQEWCNQCYRELFQNKEIYWGIVKSSKKRELFRSYLYDKHL